MGDEWSNKSIKTIVVVMKVVVDKAWNIGTNSSDRSHNYCDRHCTGKHILSVYARARLCAKYFTDIIPDPAT